MDLPADWIGRTIEQIDIRKKYGINILAVKHDGRMDLSVLPSTKLTLRDTLLVLGEYKNLQNASICKKPDEQ